MATVFYEHDANPAALKGKVIAILGYGSQGHAQAQNLRDSGYNVVVGLDPKRPSAQQAKADGLLVVSPAEAAERADWIQILTPDETQGDFYESAVKPALRPGKILGVSHGSHGIGSTRAGVLQTTFKEETESDLFGEQAVLCGGLTSLIKKGFETLVEAGYQPEVAYFECLHEMKLIVDLIYEGGLARMRDSISNTAEYGDLTRGPQVVPDSTRTAMKEILARIQDGSFAREWIDENKKGGRNFAALRESEKRHSIEEVGTRLRAMMSWLPKEAKKSGSTQKPEAKVVNA